MDKYQRYFLKHPVGVIKKQLSNYMDIRTAKRSKIKEFTVIGLVLKKKYHWTKEKNKKMAFVDLEDDTGFLSLIIWPRDLILYDKRVQYGNIMSVKVEADRNGYYLKKSKLIKKYFNS